MRILQKLLDNLGSLWNTLPKEVPFITIEKGTGAHSRVTVDGGMLYLHSQPYHKGIPQRQEVALDELTASEFVDVMQGMGYVVTYTSEAMSHGINVHKPFILLETTDAPLTATLTAYTSNLWKIMYPIYRVLRDAEFDTSEAVKAWYRPLADGEWLDFWADFFNIKREPGEDDNNFSRRFTMWLFNPKTNNVALEELLSYRLQDRNIEVRDRAALQFELVVGTKYVADASDLHNILRETKGAGIEYFLNYQADLMEEQYPIHWADKHGKPFTQMDGGKPEVWELIRAIAEAYAQPSEEYFQELIRTMSESFPEPSEDHTFVYLKKFEEMFPDISEEFTTAFTKVLADTYAGASEAGEVGLTKVEHETFPSPSEEFGGFTMGYLFSEAFINPTEQSVISFLKAFEEFVEPFGESFAETVRKLSEDLYELTPASNIGVSMTLNESELWDAETELLDTSSLHQDTALITITVGGDVIDSILV